jgi:hypothetical protein
MRGVKEKGYYTKQKLHREKGRKKEVGFGVWWRGGVRLSLEP